MLSSILKLLVSAAVTVLVCCASFSRADAVVFRDRAAFNAASQNLHTIDFESPPNIPDNLAFMEFNGVIFQNSGGLAAIVTENGNKLLKSPTIIEFTRITILLPPGTTAVGCDQFNTPMIVKTSTGESVTMTASDPSTFVGFVSDQPIVSLTVEFDFPEPTPDALIDNLSFGQRRAGNEPPVPQLLVTNSAGRAVALDSVVTTSETFHVLASHPFSTDGHTRITLFVVGVLLGPADLGFVTVEAEDTQLRLFDLPVEGTGRVKNLTWMSQVTVRVPDTLAAAGNLNVSVKVRGVVSNKAPLRIE